MYFIHKNKLSHIVKADSVIMQDLVENGDTLCLIVSDMREKNQKIGKQWTLRSTYLGKLCRNCLLMEEKIFQDSLKIRRELLRTQEQNNSDTGVR